MRTPISILLRGSWILTLLAAAIAVAAAFPGCAARSHRVNQLQSGVAAQLKGVHSLMKALDDQDARRILAPPNEEDRPFYRYDVLKAGAYGELYRPGFSEQLIEKLESGGVIALEYRTGDEVVEYATPWEQGESFAEISIPALQATAFFAQARFRGAEVDLMIPSASSEPVPVTIWYELDGRIVVRGGEPAALPDVGAGTESATRDLSERYSIGALRSGTASWRDADRSALAEALSLLSPAELAVIRGLPFHREQYPPPGAEQHAGRFIFKDGHRWIEMYDSAFAADQLKFVGSLSSRHRWSLYVVLHEVAHAISKDPGIRLLTELSERNEAVQDLVSDFNRLGKRIRHKEVSRFESILEQLEEIGQGFNSLKARIEGGESYEPILSTYARVPGAVPGPTLYARSNLTESFAEAFALCRLDRDACERISPELHEFFDSGSHLMPGQTAAQRPDRGP